MMPRKHKRPKKHADETDDEENTDEEEVQLRRAMEASMRETRVVQQSSLFIC